MPTGGKSTLTQFLIEGRRRAPAATGELNALVTDISLACKAISRRVALGSLASSAALAPTGADAQAAEPVADFAHRVFLRANEWGGHVAGMHSSAAAQPCPVPPSHPRGKYLLVFDPLDSRSGAELNVAVGSLFGVWRAAQPGEPAQARDFLQPGLQLVCAGYAIYGPSTMLVLTMGDGTHAFTLDPVLGEWVLSHPRLTIPPRTREFAINASHSRFWEPAVKRYVDECLAGAPGPRGIDFGMRWIASPVAELHRILLRGGVFLFPRDEQHPEHADRPRLLHQALPIAFLVEQAQGRASDGRQRLMPMTPREPHQRVGLVFGSAEEVERIERYHQDEPPARFDSPLFGQRGLFAAAAT